MHKQVGPFHLLKKLIEDSEKITFLAEHVDTKSSYVVYLLNSKSFENRLDAYMQRESIEMPKNLFSITQIQKDGSDLYSGLILDDVKQLQSLKEFVLGSDISEEIGLKILSDLINRLSVYFHQNLNIPFNLSLDSIFLDEHQNLIILDHLNLQFSVFLDQKNSSTLSFDAIIVAFGKIAYFLFTKRLPEGYFPMPSEMGLKLSKKIDELIKNCLHFDPKMRFQDFDRLKSFFEQMKLVDGNLQPALNPTLLERPDFDPNPGLVFTQELVVGKYQVEKTAIENIEPILTEMVIIPEGDYTQGSNIGSRDETPVHTVHLSAYAIDKHPVTNEQFVRFLEVMGGEKDSNNNDMIRLKESRIKKIAGKFQIESGYLRHPVVGVSWYGAQAYAKWVGKRLPTEAEWEIAASSAKGDLYTTGTVIEKNLANFFSSDTTPICNYPANSLGLFDMGGNVYEWCQDWYGYNYYEVAMQEPNNPQGPHQGVYRVLRGGCWKSLKDDLRVSHRHRNNPGAVNTTYGFRCAADVKAFF